MILFDLIFFKITKITFLLRIKFRKVFKYQLKFDLHSSDCVNNNINSSTTL